MLVYYINKLKNDIEKIADAKTGTYKLTDLYRILRPAFEQAPSKPYTNDKINSFAKTVKRNKASAEAQARQFVELIKRNETLMGWGGGSRKELQPKIILTDSELEMIDSTPTTLF